MDRRVVEVVVGQEPALDQLEDEDGGTYDVEESIYNNLARPSFEKTHPWGLLGLEPF